MKAVVQRVTWAKVEVAGQVVGRCGSGMLVLVGAAKSDTRADAEKLAHKIAGLRIFSDHEGKINLALSDLKKQDEAHVLVISNFTLYGDVSKSKRPSFTEAAPYEEGKMLYEHFVSHLRERGLSVETGEYGADMRLFLLNNGPVTLIVESGRK